MIFPTFASAWRIGRREPDFFDKLKPESVGFPVFIVKMENSV